MPQLLEQRRPRMARMPQINQRRAPRARQRLPRPERSRAGTGDSRQESEAAVEGFQAEESAVGAVALGVGAALMSVSPAAVAVGTRSANSAVVVAVDLRSASPAAAVASHRPLPPLLLMKMAGPPSLAPQRTAAAALLPLESVQYPALRLELEHAKEI